MGPAAASCAVTSSVTSPWTPTKQTGCNYFSTNFLIHTQQTMQKSQAHNSFEVHLSSCLKYFEIHIWLPKISFLSRNGTNNMYFDFPFKKRFHSFQQYSV